MFVLLCGSLPDNGTDCLLSGQLSPLAAILKARWHTLPLMTLPVGGVGIGPACALQVIGRSLGLLLSSHQDLNPVSSFVLSMVERLGAPAVVAFWFMEHPTFWPCFGRHRPRVSGGSGRMRRLNRSLLLSMDVKNVHSEAHSLLIVRYTRDPAERPCFTQCLRRPCLQSKR